MGRLLKSNGYLGNKKEDSKIVLFYSTFDKGDVPYDISSDSKDTKCYRETDETGTDSGITTEYNFNGATGVNRVVIDLSSSAYYSTGKDYSICRLNSIIDDETVNALLGFFSIEHRNEDW